jgi:hypothetical protein
MLQGFLASPRGKLVAAATAAVVTAFAAVSRVNKQEFGMRETFFKITSGILQPGMHPQFPFFQFTHHYESGTQRIEFDAGGCRFLPFCESTNDRNSITAKVVLNYKIQQDANKMALHRWSMDGFVFQDGYWLLTRMLNDSANAVLGKQAMHQTLANQADFLKALYEDFSFRLKQNNVPVDIESLELKEFETSLNTARTVSYEVVRGPAYSAPPPPAK